MKRIKMKVNKKGSEDGTIIKEFNEGKVYDVDSSLADVFIKEKWAVDMDTPESLERERIKKVNELGVELNDLVKGCFVDGLDSIQLAEKMDELEAYVIDEEDFQERFEDAKRIKAAGLKDAKTALKALNKANAKKDK